MHLYSPERPEASPDRKAILDDGAAVPHLYLMPQANGLTEVSVMLRAPRGEGFSWHHVEVADTEVSDLCRRYRDDPEATLASYFIWQAQPRAKRTWAKPLPTVSETEDLL